MQSIDQGRSWRICCWGTSSQLLPSSTQKWVQWCHHVIAITSAPARCPPAPSLACFSKMNQASSQLRLHFNELAGCWWQHCQLTQSTDQPASQFVGSVRQVDVQVSRWAEPLQSPDCSIACPFVHLEQVGKWANGSAHLTNQPHNLWGQSGELVAGAGQGCSECCPCHSPTWDHVAP